MGVPRFRIRTLMIAVAVSAAFTFAVRGIFVEHYWPEALFILLGVLFQLAWAAIPLLVTFKLARRVVRMIHAEAACARFLRQKAQLPTRCPWRVGEALDCRVAAEVVERKS